MRVEGDIGVVAVVMPEAESQSQERSPGTALESGWGKG